MIGQDWVDELVGHAPARPANPHYHCATQDPTPCPTGQHTNPAPSAGMWRWRVSGVEVASGSMCRGFEDSGDVPAGSAGDALAWLLAHGPVWDTLDQTRGVTVALEPVGEQPGMSATNEFDTEISSPCTDPCDVCADPDLDRPPAAGA